MSSTRLIPLGFVAVAIFVGGGCASSSGPEVVAVAPGHYQQAFDAAVETARRQGLIAVVKDRRGGVIETEPAVAGSLFEPWKGGNASLGQALDNTVNFQRRRARFEFTPAGFDPARAAASTEPTGPAAVTETPLAPDLTTFGGELELRVVVVVERAYLPGRQVDEWTQYFPSRTVIIPPGEADEPAQPLPSIFWTAFARDDAFERRLLEKVNSELRQPPPSPSTSAAVLPESGLAAVPDAVAGSH